MKKLYLLIILPLLIAATPTYVKKGDQAEYQSYLAYCNTLVNDTVEQLGRVSFNFVIYPKADIVLGNGKVMHAGEPDYCWTVPLDTVWFPVNCKDFKTGSIMSAPPIQSYYFEAKQVCIHRDHICRIMQRRASVKDFYEWWMTKN